MSGPYHYEQYPEPDPEPARLPAPRPVPAPARVPAPMTYMPAALTDQQPISTAVVVIAWIVTAFTSLYMLPWAIAASRGKANQWSVFAVNLLLGWTIIGWIVALVLSLTAHRPLAFVPPVYGYAPVAALPPAAPPAGWYPNPGGPGQRYWDGYEWTQHYA